MTLPVSLIWGLSLGFASSLHCAGMCGPIGCSILMLDPASASPASRARRIAVAQAGRILVYGVGGLAFGIFGAGLYGVVNLEAAHGILQWVAAITIMWTGLSVAGLAPAIAGFDGLMLPAARLVSKMRHRGSGTDLVGATLSGLVWGLTPCAIVYTALFNSLLAGSIEDGTVLMIAFGIGTVPAVTASSLGLYRATLAVRRSSRLWAGAALVAGGAIGLLLTAPGSPLCITHT